MKVSYAVPMIKGKGIEGKNTNGECLKSKKNLEFIDSDCLDDNQKEALAIFTESVANDIELRGKNKPSWQSDEGEDIHSAILFKENQCWHYHCGPYDKKIRKVCPMTKRLEFNPNGKTSSAVIHYRKVADDHIVVTAFSPKHIPFPRALNNSAILRKSDSELFEELEKALQGT